MTEKRTMLDVAEDADRLEMEWDKAHGPMYAQPQTDEYFSLLEVLRACPADAVEQIRLLREALRPFAYMDRRGCDLGEVALRRGIASDLNILQSRDFRRAHEALRKTGTCDCDECREEEAGVKRG